LKFTEIEKKVNNCYIESVKLIKIFEELEEKDAENIANLLKEEVSGFK